jgi:hypothetical protein
MSFREKSGMGLNYTIASTEELHYYSYERIAPLQVLRNSPTTNTEVLHRDFRDSSTHVMLRSSNSVYRCVSIQL